METGPDRDRADHKRSLILKESKHKLHPRIARDTQTEREREIISGEIINLGIWLSAAGRTLPGDECFDLREWLVGIEQWGFIISEKDRRILSQCGGLKLQNNTYNYCKNTIFQTKHETTTGEGSTFVVNARGRKCIAKPEAP